MATRNTKFKDLSLGQKIEHIWEYYKWPILGTIFGVAVVAWVLATIFAPKKDVVMTAVLLNVDSQEATEPDIFIRYLGDKGYDLENETIEVNTTFVIDMDYLDQTAVTMYQKLTAFMMMGDIDLFTGDEAIFSHLGQNGCMMDLTEVLSEETIAKYEGRLLWVEDPELEKEILCGIWLTEDNLLSRDGYYEGKVLVGMPLTATHQEMALELMHILLENKQIGE